MTSFINNTQLGLFIMYVASGMLISLFFDFFRVLRKSIKTPNTITYIEDFCFWIVVGIFIIWEIFKFSYGELRSYIFIGIITGVLIYGLTISKYFVKINVRILLFFKEVIFMPIFRIVKKPIYFILINLRQIKRKTKKKNMSNSKISFHKKKEFS